MSIEVRLQQLLVDLKIELKLNYRQQRLSLLRYEQFRSNAEYN